MYVSLWLQSFVLFILYLYLLSLKNRFGVAILTSTHNLCFEAIIRKISIPLYTPVLYTFGFDKGVYITRHFVETCFAFTRFSVFYMTSINELKDYPNQTIHYIRFPKSTKPGLNMSYHHTLCTSYIIFHHICFLRA